ncbi:NAD-dependent deacylase [Flavobacterium sp. CYK-4]|uniref:SIR2 family NAD-dependent protein deacylase n=1 Tax=Flavobacterium lotistagni TaxID=2709660 RepID=UPI00140CABF1|nr:NAD-dependent deacylase [Flavobacterium lotistagni]NHM07179.1 NAD-dependent deacylase [Flavobacterium lotistagni]
MKKKIVILSGAGISAESGIKTFRDADGLWEGHDVMEVASLEGFRKNPELVLDFYNQRRRQLQQVKPNAGHVLIAELEKNFDVQVITQNVDNLHEQAGSTNVLHLHGELLKVRSVRNENLVLDWSHDLVLGDFGPDGNQLRPHIVWFGEAVPALEEAIYLTQKAAVLIVIGTSLQVYPAAGLLHYAPANIPMYYIDPKPATISNAPRNLKVIAATGSEGMSIVMKDLATDNK